MKKNEMRKLFKIMSLVLIIISLNGCKALKDTVDSDNALPGQIIHDPNNPVKMVYNRDKNSDGYLDPFFLCGPGDPEGFLYRGKRMPDGTRKGDQMKLIRKLKKFGGNSIYLMAVRTHGGDAPNSKRKEPEIYPDDLHNPWVDQHPQNGLNMKILDQWEQWFTEMDKHGITIYFFFYDDDINVGNNLGWPLDKNGNLHPGERQFIQSLVKKFKHHRHLIWCIMEEAQEMGKDWQLHVSQIAKAISEADDHQHIIASHQHGGNVFFHKDDPNISQFALQTLKDQVHTTDDLYHWMLEANENSGGKYSIVMSEDYVHGNTSIPGNNREEFRQRCWASAMANAYVMVLRMDIANTPKSWLKDLRIIQRFFENSSYNQMHPNVSLANGETSYVLANEGYDYILYSSSAEKDLGIKQISKGTYSFTWLDCIKGRQKKVIKVEIAEGQNIFEKPGKFGKEVALYIKRMDKRPDINKIPVINKQGTTGPDEINISPVAERQEVNTSADREVYIQLRYVDADGGPGPYQVEIVSGPEHGTLTGTGNDLIYIPQKGYKGEDRFTWKVNDGKDDSNIAEVIITIEL